MSRKRKKQLTYITIGMLFLLTGIEYAVILPSLFQYLQSLGASAMYLGLTLSAFSFSGLFSGPIIGRISDRTGRTKYVLLFANLWEIGGNILYFMGLSPVYVLVSRLVAGVGSGVGAAVTADIARSTRAEERTSVLSLVMVCRQFGLILGPSCNLFLVLCDFNIGPFHVSALSAPGIFMAVLWILLEIAVVFCYYDLPTLFADENIERNIEYSAGSTITNNESTGVLDATSSSVNVGGSEATPILRASRSFNGIANSESVVNYGSFDNSDLPPSSQMNEIVYLDCDVARRASFELPSRLDQDTDTMIENAERFINATSATRSDDDVNNARDVVAIATVGKVQRSKSASSSPALRRKVKVATATSSTVHNGRVDDCHVDDDVIVRSAGDWSGWGSSYANEYCREEVVVILYSAFAALVNQTGLEAMLTPLTQRYLDWGELENSYLFLGAGIEIILVFMIVHVASKRLSDVTLITFGYSLIVISTSVLMYYLPTAPYSDQSNLAAFLFCVFTNVAGLPFVFVCTISLFSKVTKEETQGFSQGLRRTFMGIGSILGPLWTGALIDDLYLMIGVLLGVMGLALLLVLLSFRHLRRLDNIQRVEDG